MVELAINIAAFLFLAYIGLIVVFSVGAAIAIMIAAILSSELFWIMLILALIGGFIGSFFNATAGDGSFAMLGAVIGALTGYIVFLLVAAVAQFREWRSDSESREQS